MLRQRIERALSYAGLAALAIAVGLNRLGDFDGPWHLSGGRKILQDWALPKVDWLGQAGRPIVHQDWLGDVALYGFYRLGGDVGLQVFIALAAFALALIVTRQARATGVLAPVFGAAAVFASRAWLLERPATLSFAMLALLMLLIDRAREAGGRRWLLALPPLMLVWASTHGFGIVGVAIVVAFAGYTVVSRVTIGTRWRRFVEPADAALAPAALATAALVVGAVLAMPAGIRYFIGPTLAFRDAGLVTEWARPDLAFWANEPLALGLPLSFAAGALLPRGAAPSYRVWSRLVLAVSAAVAFTATRMTPVSAILGLPALAAVVGARLRLSPAGSRWLPGLLLLLACATSVLFPYTSLGLGRFAAHFPEGAVRWIQAAHPAGPMYNFPPFGGWLGFRLAPEHKVFLDGRTGWVHDPEESSLGMRAAFDDGAWREVTARHGFSYAVVRASPEEQLGAPTAADRGWALVFLDDVGAVYVRRDGPDAALAADGYQVLRHLIDPNDLAVALLGGRIPLDALRHDAALAVAQAPDSERAWFVSALAALASRDEAALAEARARLAVMDGTEQLLTSLGEIEAAFRKSHGAMP